MSARADWLEPEETEIARWTAAVPTLGGRGAKYGGHLVLTSRRLVWLPLRISAFTVTGQHLVPVGASGKRWESSLVDLHHVEPDPKRRALLHLVARDGTRTSFLVTSGRFGPVWSKKNKAARDDALSRISQAVAST